MEIVSIVALITAVGSLLVSVLTHIKQSSCTDEGGCNVTTTS